MVLSAGPLVAILALGTMVDMLWILLTILKMGIIGGHCGVEG